MAPCGMSTVTVKSSFLNIYAKDVLGSSAEMNYACYLINMASINGSSSNTLELSKGTYYVKETKAPTGLTALDVNNFDTSQVEDMS